MTKKILIIDDIHPFLKDNLSKLGFECKVDLNSSKTDFLEEIPEYFGLICRSRFILDKAFFEKAKKLKFIARAGVGVEHIDLIIADKKGVKVFTSPEGSADAVAEQIVGMMLNLVHHISKSQSEVRNGIWQRKSNSATELKAKTFGILGYGNMGKALVRKLVGFDLKVIAYDKFKSGFSDEFVKEVDIKTFFKEVDFLSINIDYTTDNHYFINKTFINSFEKKLWIVNTSRGLVLKTKDLISALKSGKILGAALDVIEYEETSFNNFSFQNLPEDFDFLLSQNNVIITPHIAGLSDDSYENHANVLFEKIKIWLGF